MTRFTSTVHTDDVLGTDPERVWAVMRDPDLLASLTPAVAAIAVADDPGAHGEPGGEPGDVQLWCWRMAGISAMGIDVAPAFTERMAFHDDPRRIRFEHAPPPGSKEAAGARGELLVAEVPDGTYVGIRITAHVDLPLPGLAGRAVRAVVDQTIVQGGRWFARNLISHLGGPTSRGMAVVDAADWPRVPADRLA